MMMQCTPLPHALQGGSRRWRVVFASGWWTTSWAWRAFSGAVPARFVCQPHRVLTRLGAPASRSLDIGVARIVPAPRRTTRRSRILSELVHELAQVGDGVGAEVPVALLRRDAYALRQARLRRQEH